MIDTQLMKYVIVHSLATRNLSRDYNEKKKIVLRSMIDH